MTRPHHQPAFTLLELLLAIGLLALLLGAVGQYAFDVLERRQHLASAMQRLRIADTLIDGVEEASLTCIASGPNNQPGIRGSSSELRISARSSWFAPEATLGPVTFACRFDEAPRSLTIERASGEERFDEISDGLVTRVRFRYWNGRSWHADFDSAQTGLPGAIEVAIWFDPPSANGTGPSEPSEDSNADPEDGGPSGFDDAPPAEMSWPAPDRVRVIAIPDGGPEPEGARS